jgi:hypothetical protein
MLFMSTGKLRLEPPRHSELRALLNVGVKEQHHACGALDECIMVAAYPTISHLLLERFARQVRNREVECPESLTVKMKDNDLLRL